jgi:hypothetical protein
MKDAQISLYCDLMEEIKRRTRVFAFLINNPAATSYRATTIESAGLQMRKILELIALASLVANEAEFRKHHADFSKYSDARRTLHSIGKVNPDFYPQPINETPSSDPACKAFFDPLKDGFLTAEEFLHVYEKLGGLMHADNPFGTRRDFKFYETNLPIWMTRTMCLMKSHLIRLVNDENLYLVHMQEDRDGKAHGYVFKPTPRPEVPV